MRKFYGSWIPVIAVYIVMLVLLILGPLAGSNWPLWFAIGIFTIWDVAWVLSDAPDRTAHETLESSTRARTYTSYFIAIYGAGLAYFLLQTGTKAQAEALAVVKNAGVSMPLLLAPLVLPAIALLFFPIRLGSGDYIRSGTLVPLSQRAPSSANLAILTMSAWTQKVGTFCFVYAVAKIGAVLAR